VSEVVVACWQLAPRIGELEPNRARGRTAIAEAAGRGARIVVLPELTSSGCAFADRRLELYA
jgi:5-aminopentanamidase